MQPSGRIGEVVQVHHRRVVVTTSRLLGMAMVLDAAYCSSNIRLAACRPLRPATQLLELDGRVDISRRIADPVSRSPPKAFRAFRQELLRYLRSARRRACAVFLSSRITGI